MDPVFRYLLSLAKVLEYLVTIDPLNIIFGSDYNYFLFSVDEGHGTNIVSVMNMVDEAMKKYDVDTRSCMARTMCNQYAERTLPAEEEAVQRISRGLIENIAQ